ncbi:MAG TPA: hypothetical protein HA252_02535 [Candidatus Diapherotrites archaeon]|uniref:DNA topoisomerase type IA zn finger domain-containing protein n=2 Tax=Candidatus Iainarchaeum sp. TaxID=3101447 RepID=A0A7J4JEW2_9ARCH|nr:hypothetical protein [Candidatus Diapherotrites archaeon]
MMDLTKCGFCGALATKMSDEGFPSCARHSGKKAAAPSCPDCGSVMALRRGKFGSFWGCITYPNCIGIRKMGA